MKNVPWYKNNHCRDCSSKERRQKLKEIINELQIIDTSTKNLPPNDESRDDRESTLSELFTSSTSLEDVRQGSTNWPV